MRNAFIDALDAAACSDDRVVLLTADLGYAVLDEFKSNHPGRYINVGIGECNMIGMATGLAATGFLPFVYSIIPFVTLRPYEFIRNGPVWHSLPVRIVGVGCGCDYGLNGITHFALEDISVMRCLRGLTIVAPFDNEGARNAVTACCSIPGPIYIRLSKESAPSGELHPSVFSVGEIELLKEDGDIFFLSLGSVGQYVMDAIDALEYRGFRCGWGVLQAFEAGSLLSLDRLPARCKMVVSVEDHGVVGGLGSLIAESISESGRDVRLVRCGLSLPNDGLVGSREYMNNICGLSGKAIADKVLAASYAGDM